MIEHDERFRDVLGDGQVWLTLSFFRCELLEPLYRGGLVEDVNHFAAEVLMQAEFTKAFRQPHNPH